ncbi:MAG: hypothetical protein IKM39_00855 [Clostridia bacterium]|nr:hypothetical protein [Clostridia bacterium]
MNLKLARCSVFISPVFMGMITVLLVIDQTGLMGAMLGAMLLHEIGHLAIMAWFGCFPKEILLLPFEINIAADQSCATMFQQFCISAGGIVMNVLAFLLVRGEFGNINLYLALFNALPLYSMDGYQMVALLLYTKKRWLFVISFVTTLVLAVLGIWLVWVHKNPMLLLFVVYLLALGVGEKRKHTVVEK